MNSAQIGNADLAPSKLSSRLSSNPTHTTHRSSVVKPANQPSRDVPVLPAAGRANPRDRTATPVPLRSTSFAPEREGRGFVGELAGGGKYLRCALHCGIDGGCIHKRFKYRAGLARREDMV